MAGGEVEQQHRQVVAAAPVGQHGRGGEREGLNLRRGQRLRREHGGLRRRLRRRALRLLAAGGRGLGRQRPLHGFAALAQQRQHGLGGANPVEGVQARGLNRRGDLQHAARPAPGVDEQGDQRGAAHDRATRRRRQRVQAQGRRAERRRGRCHEEQQQRRAAGCAGFAQGQRLDVPEVEPPVLFRRERVRNGQQVIVGEPERLPLAKHTGAAAGGSGSDVPVVGHDDSLTNCAAARARPRPRPPPAPGSAPPPRRNACGRAAAGSAGHSSTGPRSRGSAAP